MIDPILKSPTRLSGTVRIGAARPAAKAEAPARLQPQEPARGTTMPAAPGALPAVESVPAARPVPAQAAPPAPMSVTPPPAPVAPREPPPDLEALRAAARERGYEDGKSHALREVAAINQAMRAQLSQVLDAMAAAHAASLERLEQASYDIVFAAMVKVFGELTGHDDAVRAAVRQAVQGCAALPDTQVLVNPKDAELIGNLLSDPHMQAWQSWRVTGDGSVAAGGCVIRSSQGDVDARIETQLEGLAELLIQHRDAAVRARTTGGTAPAADDAAAPVQPPGWGR